MKKSASGNKIQINNRQIAVGSPILIIKPPAKHLSFLLIFFTCLLVSKSHAQQSLFNPQDLKLISSQFSFTEGPTVNKNGDVFFTDQPNDKIWKYSVDGQLTVFMDKTGRSNGLYFDKKGNLLACADEKNELWLIDKKGRVKVLVTDFEGKKLNGPNDIWPDNKGGIYLTDPYYQRDYWERKKPELEKQNVYYLPAGKKAKLRLVADDLKQPNGIVGTPDGKFLYVADLGARKTYRYSISQDGSLKDRIELVNQGSDGMTLDNQGNIYQAGNGVDIFNPEGSKIGHIDLPGWTGNLCFGGRDRTDLIITSGKSLYVLPMRTRGVE